MTLARPIPETQDPAQKRLELELLLQQPIPSPDQLRAALQLLDAVPEIAILHSLLPSHPSRLPIGKR